MSLISEDFKIDKPWDVLKVYPETAWQVIKTLHDENISLKEEKAKTDKIIHN